MYWSQTEREIASGNLQLNGGSTLSERKNGILMLWGAWGYRLIIIPETAVSTPVPVPKQGWPGQKVSPDKLLVRSVSRSGELVAESGELVAPRAERY